MSNSQIKADLMEALHKPVLTQTQMNKVISRANAGDTKSPELPWYVAFLRTSLESFALVIAGHACGFAIVAVVHYMGLDPLIESMTIR